MNKEKKQYFKLRSRNYYYFLETKDAVKKYLQEQDLDVQQAKASVIVCSFVFSTYAKKLFSQGILAPIIVKTKNFDFQEFVPLSLWGDIEKNIYKTYLEKPKVIENLLHKQESLEKEIESIFEINPLTKKELKSNFFTFDKLFSQWWSLSLLGENKGQYIQKKLSSDLIDHFSKDNSSVVDIIKDLTAFEDLSIFAKEQLFIYTACLKYSVGKSLSETFLEYKKKFFFVKSDFVDRKILTFEVFIDMIKKTLDDFSVEELKDKIQQIKATTKTSSEIEQICDLYKFTPNLRKTIFFARFMIKWGDIRKRGMMKTLYFFYSFLHAIADNYNVLFQDLLLYTASDLRLLLKKNKYVIVKELNRRKKGLVHIYSDVEQFHYDADLVSFCESYLESKSDNITGFVASTAGLKTVSGIVRVVSDPLDSKFQKGEILVTSMTRPEFIPLIKHAKAIITNEGGLTCHAAIVSRELQTPCIVGTKNATLLLKDGLKVTLNLQNGKVLY